MPNSKIYLLISLIIGCIMGFFVFFINNIICNFGSSQWCFFVIILNIFLSIGVMVLYFLKNRNSFNILSPYFFPLVMLFMVYIIPAINLGIIKNKYIDERALYLQTIGIMAYLLGASLFGLYKEKFICLNIKFRKNINMIAKQQEFVMRIFLILGILLLVTYGLISRVTIGLLNRQNIEGLRRTAEVGRGFIKEPGIFFTTFCSLWLVGTNLIKGGRLRIRHFLFLIFICSIIFGTTGNKGPALSIFICMIYLCNKFYRKVALLKILIFGVFMFILVGSLQVARSNGSFEFSNIKEKAFASYVSIYEVNYIPLVKLVSAGILKLQYGKEYLQNATAIIPRFLWPNKPISFDYFLKDVLHLRFAGGGVPASIIGSLYLNFGFLGVVIGMSCIGFFYCHIFQIYITGRDLFMTLFTMSLLGSLMNPALFLSRVLFMFFYMIIILAINKILSVGVITSN